MRRRERAAQTRLGFATGVRARLGFFCSCGKRFSISSSAGDATQIEE
jgi:hypothetical protein